MEKQIQIFPKIQNTGDRIQNIIDNIFRVNLNNPLVINKIINVEKVKFLKAYITASIFNEKTYFGNCTNCPDMCGIEMKK